MNLNTSIIPVRQLQWYFGYNIVSRNRDMYPFYQTQHNLEILRAEWFAHGGFLEDFDYDILRLCTRFIQLLVNDQYCDWKDQRWPFISRYLHPLDLTPILGCHSQQADMQKEFQNQLLLGLKSFQRIVNTALMDANLIFCIHQFKSHLGDYPDAQSGLRVWRKELFRVHPDTGGEGDADQIHAIKARMDFWRKAQDLSWLEKKRFYLANIDSFYKAFTYQVKYQTSKELQACCFQKRNDALIFHNALAHDHNGHINIAEESLVVQLLYPYLQSHMKFLRHLLPDLTHDRERVKSLVKENQELRFQAKRAVHDSAAIHFGSAQSLLDATVDMLYYYLHPLVFSPEHAYGRGPNSHTFLEEAPFNDCPFHYGDDLSINTLHYLKDIYTSSE